MSIKMEDKPDLTKPQTVKLCSTGESSIHGVSEQKTIPLTVDYKPTRAGKPAQIRVHGNFPVKLEQFHIKRPEAVLVTLANTVFVDVLAVGKISNDGHKAFP